MSDNATPNDEAQDQAIEPDVPDGYEAWEVAPDMPHVVMEEMNRYGLRPRDAKAILEAAGKAVQDGSATVRQIQTAIRGAGKKG